jgi:hypothetical protein
MRAFAEEAVEGLSAAIQFKSAKFQIGGTGGKFASVDSNHGLGVRGASPDEIDGSTAAVLENDPSRRRTTLGRLKRRVQRVGTRKKADHRARFCK